MDLSTERDATVFYLKFLKAVMITENLDETLRLARELGIEYTSIELLKMLRDIVIPHTQNNSLPENVNQNIYTFINICRFDCTDKKNRKERFAICNEILDLLNTSKDKTPYPIYQSMINTYGFSFLEKIKYHSLYITVPSIVKNLFASVVELEYLTLFFHSSVIDTTEFMEDISEDLVLSLAYLIANEHLIREDPNLLQDPRYLSRLSFILENNEMLLECYKGNPSDECWFEIDPGDEEVFSDKKFWRLQQKIKKKVIKAQKDS